MNTQSFPAVRKEEGELLRAAALRYGFSPDELIRRIVAEITQAILDIPEESLDEYENPQEIKRALHGALRAERSGKILRSLPRKTTPSRA